MDSQSQVHSIDRHHRIDSQVLYMLIVHHCQLPQTQRLLGIKCMYNCILLAPLPDLDPHIHRTRTNSRRPILTLLLFTYTAVDQGTQQNSVHVVHFWHQAKPSASGPGSNPRF